MYLKELINIIWNKLNAPTGIRTQVNGYLLFIMEGHYSTTELLALKNKCPELNIINLSTSFLYQNLLYSRILII